MFDIEEMLLSCGALCVCVCVSTWDTELLCLSIKNIHHRQQKGLEAYLLPHCSEIIGPVL